VSIAFSKASDRDAVVLDIVVEHGARFDHAAGGFAYRRPVAYEYGGLAGAKWGLG
jgi:hypothetical protein